MLHLPSLKTVVYTCRKPHCLARHPGITAMLNERGYSDWSFFYGQSGEPYWKAIISEYAALLQDNEPPFCILEDDIKPYRWFADLEPPPGSPIVYLGGGGTFAGGRVARSCERHLPGHDIYRSGDISLEDIDQTWVRPLGMFGTHAILYLDKQVMLDLARILLHNQHEPHDVTLGWNQWRWNCALLRTPMFYQNDGHNDRGTIDYCRPRPARRAPETTWGLIEELQRGP